MDPCASLLESTRAAIRRLVKSAPPLDDEQLIAMRAIFADHYEDDDAA